MRYLSELYRLITKRHTDIVVLIDEAHRGWKQGADERLLNIVEGYRKEDIEISPSYLEQLNIESSLLQETERVMFAGLAVAIASVTENIVGGMCKHLNLPLVKSDGTRIERPNFGNKQTAIEKHLGIKFCRLTGFDGNRLARLLANCYKHSEGRVNQELAKAFRRTKGEVIAYEKENWGHMISETKLFLDGLGARL